MSGVRRTHFCGAYWFYGFHEDGLRSAIRVARALGVVVTLPLTLLVIVFALSNRGPVAIGLWPFDDLIEMPIYLLALGALGLGDPLHVLLRVGVAEGLEGREGLLVLLQRRETRRGVGHRLGDTRFILAPAFLAASSGQKRRITLTGYCLPLVEGVAWRGTQRRSKTYYPGSPEATIQVLGPEETDDCHWPCWSAWSSPVRP